MEFEALQTDTKKRMQAAIASLDHNLKGLRTGRASVNLLDHLVVDGVYGSERMPLNQLGTVTVPDARMLVVQVWDKAAVKAVEKAIANANLGLNPQADGQLIRVPMPPLSEERRKELAKVAKADGENAKVAIRNIRRDAMDEIKKMKDGNSITEDQQKKYTEQIQKVTDDFIKEVETHVSNKEKEILSQ